MHSSLPTAPVPRRDFHRLAAFWLTLLIALPALAQSGAGAGSSTESPGSASSSSASSSASDTTASKTISPDQLASLVAPIALYPDALVAQILMASTYPLEIVEAARWVKANPDLKTDALEDAMQKQSWDPSVKSLTAFPQVLAMMNDKLTWTNQLGVNSLQALRQKAKTEGNLETNSQQTVTVEDQATGSQSQTIIIQPTNPQVVYVPTYNPTVVYGTWAYPMYPPYYWYPPTYVYSHSAVSFGVGLAVGAAMWGNCNWHSSNVNINVNHYNSFNRTNIKSTRGLLRGQGPSESLRGEPKPRCQGPGLLSRPCRPRAAEDRKGSGRWFQGQQGSGNTRPNEQPHGRQRKNGQGRPELRRRQCPKRRPPKRFCVRWHEQRPRSPPQLQSGLRESRRWVWRPGRRI